jgi:hypothetical protein
MGGPLKNVWTLFASGKNLRVRDDVTRRSLLIRLDAEMENPQKRQFRGNPFAAVQADRGRYVAAALTIVKAYHAAGRPGRLPGIGDPFAGWSDNVRSALVWLGRADPVATMDESRANDPARQTRIAILQAIYSAYRNEPVSAGHMIEDAKAGIIRRKSGERHDLSQAFAGGGSGGSASDLKDAIIAYADAKLDAQHLGRKFGIDRDTITGDRPEGQVHLPPQAQRLVGRTAGRMRSGPQGRGGRWMWFAGIKTICGYQSQVPPRHTCIF